MSAVPYKAAVGCLIYLTVWTRFDIAKATHDVAQFSNNPGKTHWQSVKRIYRYLAGTRNHGITYRASGRKKLLLEGWSNADWAANPDSRRSMAAYIFTLGGPAVTWSTKLLPTICLSSTKSEYGSLTGAGKEAIAGRATLSDLEQKQSSSTELYCDNQSAIALSKNARFHACTRHIEVAHHFIQHLTTTKQVEVEYVKTEENLADLLTKGLPRDRHNSLTCKLGLAPISADFKLT